MKNNHSKHTGYLKSTNYSKVHNFKRCSGYSFLFTQNNEG